MQQVVACFFIVAPKNQLLNYCHALVDLLWVYTTYLWAGQQYKHEALLRRTLVLQIFFQHAGHRQRNCIQTIKPACLSGSTGCIDPSKKDNNECSKQIFL